jgi:dihydrofolate reductase
MDSKISQTKSPPLEDLGGFPSEDLGGHPSLSLIVATSINNAIGKDNKMLWHLPEDFKYFKNTTWGMPIIMGRKTFESIGKALPGRTNIVITNNKAWQAEGAEVAYNLEDAIEQATKTNATEIFITGGAEIYRQSILKADKIYRTLVHTDIDGDTFFPEIDENVWQKKFEKNIKADAKNIFDMSFQVWERKWKVDG